MAKSKAERMREYRARKKEQLGEKEWLKKERARTKPYFKPMALLDESKQIEIRENNRINQIRFRRRKRQQKNTDVDRSNTESLPSTSTESNENEVSSTTDTTLTIKLPFPSRAQKGKKRSSRALSTAYRRVETLEDQNEALKRKLRSAQRRLQRYEEKKKQSNTPRGKTDSLLKQSGINPQAVPEIRKKLIFSECINEEIRSAKDAQKNRSDRKTVVHKVVSERVIKRYRLKSTLEEHTSLNRRKSYACKSVLLCKRSRLTTLRQNVRNEVLKFLERDDNSRVMPGKADAAKSGSGKIQKRVLSDYMYNLHQKFIAESTIRISKSSFYKCRPNYICPVNFASRSVCLCSKHQNFCFLLRTLKALNVTTCGNPDKFVQMYQDSPSSLTELLNKIPSNDEKVKFQQWKRVKMKNGKERQRVVEVEKTRSEFIEMMAGEFSAFEGHVLRVKDQYVAVKTMKEKLPRKHVLIQMDFSENYTCNTLEEIQSAYWNSCMITLHPTVIYFRSDDNQLTHSSYVFVSEVLSHNAAMVIAIIDKLMGLVKSIIPDLQFVHFWTDSPSSQYRNKTIFDLVSNFEQRYDTCASWHYFECGHGKGPCDGVGGTTKRNADNAVKQGKVLIQDAEDFFAWASQEEGGIKYQLITEQEYNHSKTEVDDRNAHIKPVKGSMKLHAVIGQGDGRLLTRNTSCACDDCFVDKFNSQSKCNWNETAVTKRIAQDVEASTNQEDDEPEIDQTDDETTRNPSEPEPLAPTEVSEGFFVVARYDNKKYIGQVLEVCFHDNTVHINFMVDSGKRKGCFKWPITEDKVWRDMSDIIKVIETPMQTTKARRLFSVPENVLKLVCDE